MEKNTAWAIGLSTVVLVAFFAFQTYFMPKNTAQNQQPAQENEAVKTAENPTNEISTVSTESSLSVASENSTEVETLTEETFTLETNKAKITFTNRGGDIISYELKDHKDGDTGKGVEMADNISEQNRAFSIAFGGSDKSAIDGIFTAKKIDDKTIGFYKRFNQKNSDGSESSFTLVKTYYFNPDDYAFKLDVTIEGGEGFTGLDFNGASYTIRTAPQIGPYFNPKADRYENRSLIAFNGEKKKEIVFSANQTKSYDKNWLWAAVTGKYFEILVYPQTAGNMTDSITYTTVKNSVAKSERETATNAQLYLSRKAISSGKTTDSYIIYVGPRDEKSLNSYNLAENNAWKLQGVHFNESLKTSGFLSPLETLLKICLEWINKLVHNWGISIIILTAILKFAMFPLTKKTAMGTVKMQQMQPKMQAIQAKYKDNPQKMQAETAKLYKEIGYNPMAGCLPMLFTFIILWAMFNLFNNYFEFRGASFIPGWIDDLSTGDSVYSFKNSLPFLGWNQVRILPVIYVISQLFFGKFTQNGGTSAGPNATQMKVMMYGMPLFFFFIFYNAPAGLLLYWTVSNVIQLGQQLVINHLQKNARAESGNARRR